jgi:hypothetical protein
MVVPTHDFDLLRFYFGDPLWCSATILVMGGPLRLPTRDGREPIRVLGDTIHAEFGFRGNLVVSWPREAEAVERALTAPRTLVGKSSARGG